MEDETRVRDLIAAMAGKVDGDDFWIAGRPFFVAFREPDADIRDLVLGGWHPGGEVAFCAMANGQSDHVLLGAICHRTADLLGGLIDLGDLRIVTDDPTVLTFDSHRPIEGFGYFVTPEFLAYWMGSDEFRLVK